VQLLLADYQNSKSIFDVSIEGVARINNVDVFKGRDGRPYGDYNLTIPNVEVSDGVLNVRLTGKATISGIVISQTKPFSTKQWQLVFADEFNVDGAIDESNWNYIQWAPKRVNNELQRYTNRLDNVRVANGNLIIEARQDNYMGDSYSSGRITTQFKQDLLYGRIEVRAKLPTGKGTWPAIWMMPTDSFKYATTCNKTTGWDADCDAWPKSGEIDIMEHVGYDQDRVWATVHNFAHYWVNFQQRKAAIWNGGVSDSFHTYAIEWSEHRIDMFVDDIRYFSYINQGKGWQSWPYDHPYHLIINLAVGGNWGGLEGVDENIWPQQLVVDYVRFYQRTSSLR